MAKKKTSMGRQRIPIAKISKKSYRQVTFSKRRAGLFKKASELCTLCGVEIAIVVFSPANKAFSFGHHEVESVISRYLSRNALSGESTSHNQLNEAHRNANIRELNLHLTELLDQLEAEKKKGDELDKSRQAGESQCWWQAPIDELRLPELQRLRAALKDLKKNVAEQASRIMVESMNPSLFSGVHGVGQMTPFKKNEINAASTFAHHVYGHGCI